MASDSGFKPQKEINRIKAQVRKLEREKDKSFPGLGRLAYQSYQEGRLNDPALAEACGRLKEIDSQVEQANAQIADLQAQAQQMKEIKGAGATGSFATCSSCGAAVTPGLKFCGNCGAPLTQGPSPQAPPAMSCPSCGSPLEPNARFCGECGNLMGAGEPPAAPQSPTGGVAAPQAPPTPPSPPSPPSAPIPPSTPAPPPAPAPPVSPGAAKPLMKCPTCGAVVEEATALFCGECGAKIG